nr:HDOD domain-containing protein [Dissulfurirhabdus thermomarina]
MPPFPVVAQQLLAVLADDPNSVSRLEQIIRHDPTLASQILKVANSAAYAPTVPIDTVHRAIVYLGFFEIRNIALGLAVFSVFKPGRAVRGFDVRRFWHHSIAAAMVSRILATETGEADPEVFFTAGLLHDIGRLAMNAAFREEFREILDEARDRESSLLAAEKRAGLSHAVIGAWLARNWGLPEVFVRTIAGHHLPPDHPKSSRQAALIQIADQVCHAAGFGLFKPPPCRLAPLAAHVGLEMEALEHIQEEIEALEEISETVTDLIGFLQ